MYSALFGELDLNHDYDSLEDIFQGIAEFLEKSKDIVVKKTDGQVESECKCGGNCESKEIIHCKDCAYFDENKANCNLTSLSVSENDYCSMGNKNKFVETITKEEYETLSMLKALGAERLVYNFYYFSGKEFICAHGANFNAEISDSIVKKLKHLFNKQSERKIDDLMKLEVID